MGRQGTAGTAAPLSGRRPVVIALGGAVPPWAHRIPGRVDSDAERLEERLGEAASVWIDGSMDQALDVARTVYRHDAAVQVGIVAAREDRHVIERRLLFTPGLGEVWLVAPEEVDAALLEEAAEVTRTRRSFRQTRARFIEAARTLRGVPAPRAVVSDAHLAALLQVLPDPVLSVDEEGRVVTWSAAAERLLGRRAGDAIGRPLDALLATDPPDALDRLLEDARTGTARREIRLGGRPLVMDAVATPVAAAGVQVRAVVLRDVTTERESVRQLESAMALRSRFFASMSHEIRTPINAILGYNDLLLSGAMGELDETQTAHIERSQNAARHLLELVNDVLDLSKLEAGKIEFRFEAVRAGALMDELAATLRPLADRHDTDLVQECQDAELVIRTDPRRVKQILLNLVSNAVKFGEGRPVTLRCLAADGAIRFEVEDRGRGIAPEDQERIFEEFAQVGAVEGGTGLGLSISRRLAELLGGTLQVDSAPGEGSTFWLELPLAGPGEPA